MSDDNPTKLCTVCGEPINGDCYSGIPSRHKECHKRKVRENRAARLDYYQAYDRDRFQNNPERRAAQLESMRKTQARRTVEQERDRVRKYRRENPEKWAAHIATNSALKNGKLTRDPFCELCGAPSEHAHHDDYSKPLDVRWLCVPCHKRVHREINEAKRKRARNMPSFP